MADFNGYANVHLKSNRKPGVVAVDPIIPTSKAEYLRLNYRQRLWLKMNEPATYRKFANPDQT